MLVLTNNPKVAEMFAPPRSVPDTFSLEVAEGTAYDVLCRALNMLAENKCGLYAHPIAGNERLLRNPYRTVVFEDTAEHAGRGAEDIIRAMAKAELIDYSEVPQNAYDDYATVDAELFMSIVRRSQAD